MSSFRTVPAFVAHRLAAGSMHGFLDGSVLHVDVSGFTSMTERLMAHGHRGAEEMSGFLNAIFEEAVGIIHGAGGFIATFAGDSFTAVFPGVGLERSRSTAERTRRVLNGLEPGPGFRPEYRFCLSQGEMEWGITGSPGMRAYFFRGDPVFSCSELAAGCEPGELAVDRGIPPVVSKGGAEPAEVTASVEESFFPAAALASGRTGEFREVVSVFTGFDEDIPYGELDGLTRLLLAEAADLGGYISGVFFDDKGGNALTLFGAPLARERLEDRALEYVRSLRSPGLLGIRFGVCRGMVYAGRIGSRERFTYSVIGDPVNTAAKLLNHCPSGGALVACPEDYRPSSSGLAPAGSVELRGKSRPVPVAEVAETTTVSDIQRRRESGLTGRGDQLAQGLQAVRDAHRGAEPAVVYICGEAGMGKSRLLSELSSLSPPDSARLVVQCDDLSRRGMGPVARMLGDYFWLSGSGRREKDFRSGWTALRDGIAETGGDRARKAEMEFARARPPLRRLLGLPSGDAVFDSLDPARRYSNTVFAVKAFLKALSLLSPVLLAVEDLHWADPDTSEVLRTLLRRLQGYPIALLVTARPGEGGGYPKLDVPGEVSRTTLSLAPLSGEESRTLAASLLGGRPSQGLMDFLDERCRGNPFYLEQYCAYLLEREELRESSGGLALAVEDAGMPEGVRSTIVARLDRLPENLRSLVQTASVLGKDFQVGVLSRMAAGEDSEALLREGVDQGVWTAAGGDAYAFSHVLIRDAAYEMQLGKSLRRLHADAAMALREEFGGSPEHWSGAAFHLERAGRPEEAAEYLLLAARHAAGEYRNREALHLYGRYLETAGEGAREAVEVLESMARISGIVGHWDRAEELFGKTVETAGPESSAGLYATVELASFLRSVGRLEEASGLLEGCRRDIEASGDAHLIAEHLLAGARVRIDMGEYSRSLEEAGNAMEIALEAGSVDTAISASRAMGSAMASVGDSDGALKAYRRALGMLEDRRAPVERAELLGSMGNVHLERQRYDMARDLYARSLQLAEEAGHRQYISFATGNLGIVHQMQGRPDRAEELLRHQEMIGGELGDSYTMATAWMNLSLVEMARGRFDRALELSRSAGDAYRGLKDRAGVSYALALSGNLLCLLGRAGEAGESLSDAIRLGRECNLAFYLAEYLVSYAWLLVETGRYDDAESTAREAASISGEVGRDRCTSRAELALYAAGACRGSKSSRQALRRTAEDSEDPDGRILAHYALYLAGGGPHEAEAAREEIAAAGGPGDSTAWRVLTGTGGPL